MNLGEGLVFIINIGDSNVYRETDFINRFKPFYVVGIVSNELSWKDLIENRYFDFKVAKLVLGIFSVEQIISRINLISILVQMVLCTKRNFVRLEFSIDMVM